MVCFPACDSRLSNKKQTELLTKFKSFENGVIGKEYYPVFHSMVEKFEDKYLNQATMKEMGLNSNILENVIRKEYRF